MVEGMAVKANGADGRSYEGKVFRVYVDHNGDTAICAEWSIHRGRKHFTELETSTLAYAIKDGWRFE